MSLASRSEGRGRRPDRLLLAGFALWIGCSPAPGGGGLSPTGAVPERDDAHPHSPGVWCDACGAGFVAGVRVPSRVLFETLDAHGHVIAPASFRCASCQRALRADGFCKRCRMGFLSGQAYLSKLAYFAARGSPSGTSGTPCAACPRPPAGGWCEECDRGWAGDLAFLSREETEACRQEIERLRRSIALLDRCERCAVASFTGGRCRKCSPATTGNGPPAGVEARSP